MDHHQQSHKTSLFRALLLHVALDAGLTSVNSTGNLVILIIQFALHISFAVLIAGMLTVSGYFHKDAFETKYSTAIMLTVFVVKFALIFFHFIPFNMYYLNFLAYIACIRYVIRINENQNIST